MASWNLDLNNLGMGSKYPFSQRTAREDRIQGGVLNSFLNGQGES